MSALIDTLSYDVAHNRHGWPFCAKCKRPAESVASARTHNGGLVVAVYCHGKEERITINESIVDEMIGGPNPIDISGEVFVERKLLK